MKTYKEYLIERRYFLPHKLEILESYNDPDIYVSFSNLDGKLGLKPTSTFYTPLGIYFYSIQYVIDSYQEHLDAFDLPFAENRKYFYIVKPTKPLTIVNDITDREVDNLVYDLQEFYPMDEETFYGLYDTCIDDSYKYGNTPGHKYMNLTKIFSCIPKVNVDKYYGDGERLYFYIDKKLKGCPAAWNKLLQRLGHYGLHDEGESIIHSNEPSQTVILETRYLKILEQVDNKVKIVIDSIDKLIKYQWYLGYDEIAERFIILDIFKDKNVTFSNNFGRLSDLTSSEINFIKAETNLL